MKVETRYRGQKQTHGEETYNYTNWQQPCTRMCSRNKIKPRWRFRGARICNPGTGVNIITTSAKTDIQHLSKQDVVVAWGGSKDVGKNETKKGINYIQRFVKTNSHTNFILMEVPQRYDLEQISCINKEVDKYNRRIWKHKKIF